MSLPQGATSDGETTSEQFRGIVNQMIINGIFMETTSQIINYQPDGETTSQIIYDNAIGHDT